MENKKSNGKNKSGLKISDIRPIHTVSSKIPKKKSGLNRMHVLLDLYECDEKALAKADLLEQKVLNVLSSFNLEPKIQTFYQFDPFGVTAIVYAHGLQFTMHTWPEYKSAAIDLYSFNTRSFATNVSNSLVSIFQSSEYEMKVRSR